MTPPTDNEAAKLLQEGPTKTASWFESALIQEAMVNVQRAHKPGVKRGRKRLLYAMAYSPAAILSEYYQGIGEPEQYELWKFRRDLYMQHAQGHHEESPDDTKPAAEAIKQAVQDATAEREAYERFGLQPPERRQICGIDCHRDT